MCVCATVVVVGGRGGEGERGGETVGMDGGHGRGRRLTCIKFVPLRINPRTLVKPAAVVGPSPSIRRRKRSEPSCVEVRTEVAAKPGGLAGSSASMPPTCPWAANGSANSVQHARSICMGPADDLMICRRQSGWYWYGGRADSTRRRGTPLVRWSSCGRTRDGGGDTAGRRGPLPLVGPGSVIVRHVCRARHYFVEPVTSAINIITS